MKIVLLIPGLKDANATGLKRLTPFLEKKGYLVRALPYGWFFIRGFLWAPFNKPLAILLAGFTELLHTLGHEIVAIAHSNGAAIVSEASVRGAFFDMVVLINGATERDIKLGPNTGWVFNIRVASDPVLLLARIIGLASPWADLDGSLGSSGVKDDSDPRMWDLDATERWGIKASHGGVLSEANIQTTGPHIANVIEYHLQTAYPLTRT